MESTEKQLHSSLLRDEFNQSGEAPAVSEIVHLLPCQIALNQGNPSVQSLWRPLHPIDGPGWRSARDTLSMVSGLRGHMASVMDVGVGGRGQTADSDANKTHGTSESTISWTAADSEEH
ncbi:hypothetical protein EYF80_036151 [Liparis tanakae]|uniref:Uncharacterized protein n=1 Tax=Liparis tanakae TaxID=230148 RepID=A0A4Z2GLG8_9TELE|nr:hypothetical protein EYF80_036151 [Liparis tanakae]